MTHKHDCEYCIFLATVAVSTYKNPMDLYFCKRCDGGTVIARYGSDGPNYASTPVNLLHKNSEAILLLAWQLYQDLVATQAATTAPDPHTPR